MRPFPLLVLAVAGLVGGSSPLAGKVDSLLQQALAAEGRLETQRALDLLLEVEKDRPDDPAILRRIARQYSDLTLDLADASQRRTAVERALAYSRRAATLEPGNAESALCIAVCYGKLAVLGGVSDRVRYSRLVRQETERALQLDPSYAWAHHLLGRWHHEVAALGTTARMVVTLFYGGLPEASTAEAVRHLERAVALEPHQLQHHLELGFALLADGQTERARESFLAGLALPSREKHDEPAKARARAALEKLGGTVAVLPATSSPR